MREQTRAIKDILKTKYPISKFKLKYVETSNYIDGSDKIIITCDKDICVEDIISLVKNNIIGIAVFKQGDIGMISEGYGKHNNPQILLVETNEWLDADVMEFIEVRSSRLSFDLIKKMSKIKR